MSRIKPANWILAGPPHLVDQKAQMPISQYLYRRRATRTTVW
jgi:hypothetical protein